VLRGWTAVTTKVSQNARLSLQKRTTVFGASAPWLANKHRIQKIITAHLHQLMPRKLSMWHPIQTMVFHCLSAFQTNSSLTPPRSQCGGMVPSHGKVNDTASGVAGPTSPAPLMAATLQR